MYTYYILLFSIAVPNHFNIEFFNSIAARTTWSEVKNPYLNHYTVYYYPNLTPNGVLNWQENETMVKFLAGSNFGVIVGLKNEQEYLFSIAVTCYINGKMVEGKRTEPVPLFATDYTTPTTQFKECTETPLAVENNIIYIVLNGILATIVIVIFFLVILILLQMR